MPNVMAAQPKIGGALCKSSVIPFPCTMPQNLADARCCSAVQELCQYRKMQDLDAK